MNKMIALPHFVRSFGLVYFLFIPCATVFSMYTG